MKLSNTCEPGRDPGKRNSLLLGVSSSGSLVGLVVVLALSFHITVVSAEETTTTSGADSSTKLSGSVSVDTTLNELRDARLSVSRVRKAVTNLYDEMTRQQVTMTYQPNVVGTTVFSTPKPIVTGSLPARPKWVQASMAEISPIINLFKEDVDAAIESNRRTDVSPSARKSLDPIREEAFSSIKKSFDVYKELSSLTAAPPYDNNLIATKTKDLDNEMKQLDRSLKKGMSILQKEAKASRKKK